MRIKNLVSVKVWKNWFMQSNFAGIIPDELFLRMRYEQKLGKKLNIDNPVTFNEKLQWLKLHDRRPEYTMLVDKWLVRDHIKETLGEEYLIPLLGVYDDPDEINFDALPDKFVLKCNHNSGVGMCICKDKSKLDIDKVKKELRKGLAQDYYLTGREWPYKNVPRKIIAEQYMEDEDNKGDLSDYKIHCFNGEPKVIQVITDRFSSNGMINDHYYPSWEKLDLVRGHHATSNMSISRPAEMDEMLELAKKLSVGSTYLRTDFYIVSHQIYFGELTFFPASGFNPFHPEKWDRIWGDWIKLPMGNITE